MRILRSVAAVPLVAGAVGCGDSVAPVEAPRAVAIAIAAGDGQESMTYNGAQAVTWGGFLPESLRVRVTDAAGAPVPGAEVVWTTMAGSLEPAVSTTDSTGTAAALWRWDRPGSGAVPPGSYTAAAQIPGVDFVTFTGHARAGLLLRALEILPDTVDVAAGPAEVTVRVRIIDDRDVGGVQYGQFLFSSPPGAEHAALGRAFTLVSGTPKDGVYEGTAVVPEGAASGDWRIAVTLGWGCGAANRYEWNSAPNFWSSRWFDELGLPRHLHVVGGSGEGASASRRGRGAGAPDGVATPGEASLQVTPCGAPPGSASPRLARPASAGRAH